RRDRAVEHVRRQGAVDTAARLEARGRNQPVEERRGEVVVMRRRNDLVTVMELRRQHVDALVLQHSTDLAKMGEEILVLADVLDRARRVTEVEHPVRELERPHVHAHRREACRVDAQGGRGFDGALGIVGPRTLPGTARSVQVGHGQESHAAGDGVEEPLVTTAHREPLRRPVEQPVRLQRPEDAGEFPLLPMEAGLLGELHANHAIEQRIAPVRGVAQFAERLHGSTSASTRATRARWSRTEASQVNVLARTRPRSTRRRETSGRVITRLKASAIWSGCRGSMYNAASPHTSGTAPTRAVTTGQPRAMASSGANPKPSYSDEHTSADAPSSSAIFSASVTEPRNMIRPPVGPLARAPASDPSPAMTRRTFNCRS